jgi:hypothetical protein
MKEELRVYRSFDRLIEQKCWIKINHSFILD